MWGFDRLTCMNYSPQQIAQLRDNFHAMRGTRQAGAKEEKEWTPVLLDTDNPTQGLQQDPEAPPPNHFDPFQEGDHYVLEQHPWVDFGLPELVFRFVLRSQHIFFFGLLRGSCLRYGLRAYLDIS